MEEVTNPVMEVVEHIIHHITDIFLQFTDIDNWGLTNASRLFNLTKEAIELGYYNVNQYEEINEAGIRNRVILQEYAYWIIYTSWNLRNSHGPDHSEWSIFTSSELENKLKTILIDYEDVWRLLKSVASKLHKFSENINEKGTFTQFNSFQRQIETSTLGLSKNISQLKKQQ